MFFGRRPWTGASSDTNHSRYGSLKNPSSAPPTLSRSHGPGAARRSLASSGWSFNNRSSAGTSPAPIKATAWRKSWSMFMRASRLGWEGTRIGLTRVGQYPRLALPVEAVVAQRVAGSPAAKAGRPTRSLPLSFAVRLDLHEVERLLLAERGLGVLFRRPVRDGQLGGRPERLEDLPVVGDPHRDLRLRVGGVRFRERPLGIDLDPFQDDAPDELVRLVQFLLAGVGQILIVAGKHLQGVQPPRLEVLDGLGERVGPPRAAPHPQELVPDRLAVPRVAPLDPAVPGEAPDRDAPLLRGPHRPALGPVREVRVAEVREGQWVLGQHLRLAVDGVMPIQLADEPHRVLV